MTEDQKHIIRKTLRLIAAGSSPDRELQHLLETGLPEWMAYKVAAGMPKVRETPRAQVEKVIDEIIASISEAEKTKGQP